MHSTITETIVHPFEAAGLGKAPFRYAGAVEQDVNRDGMCVIGHVLGCAVETKPGGTCAYCGHAILAMFNVESSDGKKFHVGCECIKKVAITNPRALKADIKRQQDAKADARITDAVKLLEAESVRQAFASQPHPAAWAQAKGLTKLDWLDWMLEHSGRSGKLSLARLIERTAKTA